MKRQQEMGIVRVFVTIECWCDIPNRSWPDAGTRGLLWWMPTEDAEPGSDVVSVVRVGDDPHLRRTQLRRTSVDGTCERVVIAVGAVKG
jgi:hypothetical protein